MKTGKGVHRWINATCQREKNAFVSFQNDSGIRTSIILSSPNLKEETAMLPIQLRQTVSAYCKHVIFIQQTNRPRDCFPFSPRWPRAPRWHAQVISFIYVFCLDGSFLHRVPLKASAGLICSSCFKHSGEGDWTTPSSRGSWKQIYSRRVDEPRPGKQCHLSTPFASPAYSVLRALIAPL